MKQLILKNSKHHHNSYHLKTMKILVTNSHHSKCLKYTSRSHYSISSSTMSCWNGLISEPTTSATLAGLGHFAHLIA